MEKLLLNLFENFHIIIMLFVVICFIIPIVLSTIRRSKRKLERDILDKKTILIDSGIYSKIGIMLFLFVFAVVGLGLIYLSINKVANTTAMITGIIFGIIMCAIPVIISFTTIKTAVKILKGNYVIVLDELMDKYYYNDTDTDPDRTDHSHWRFYFKDFFKKYDQYVRFESLREGNKYNKGNKFYLVFLKGEGIPYIFATKEYNLAPSENDKLKTIDEIENYTKLKKFVLEKEILNEKIVINKSRIKKDFTKARHRKTAIIFVLISIFITWFVAMSILVFQNFAATIILPLVMPVWIFLTIIKLKYVIEIYSNINKGKFEIKEDEVISLNNRVTYAESNRVTSFKFKNYKKLVYEDKRVYHDTQIGDKFYLVFVKGEEEPIKVYNCKNSVLGNEK